MAASAALLTGNFQKVLKEKADAQKKNEGACRKCCNYCWPEFLADPCSWSSIIDILNGQYHTCILSTFMLYAIFTIVYSIAFGIEAIVLYIAFAFAIIGPCWTSLSISDKLRIAGVSSTFSGECRELRATNLQLKENLAKYKREISTLQTATNQVTLQSHNHRTIVRKAIHIGEKMQGEDKQIEKEITGLRDNTKKIRDRRKTLDKRMQDFEERVAKMMAAQDEMLQIGTAMKDRQQTTGEVIDSIKHVPETFSKGVKSILWVKGFYKSAGKAAQEIAPMVEQMAKEYTRFAKVIRLQELALMRTIAFDIARDNDRDMTRQDFALFVERLPTYLSDTVTRKRFRFNDYTNFRYGAARRIQRTGLRDLLNNILDAVEESGIPGEAGDSIVEVPET